MYQLTNDHDFERTEDRTTVFLKWTDFNYTYFPSKKIEMPNSDNEWNLQQTK